MSSTDSTTGPADGTESLSQHSSRGALSRERIVTATLALIDDRGLAGVSMRSVADQLGARAMALYRHVGSREELFDAVIDRIVDELSNDPFVSPSAAGEGWDSYLSALAGGIRRYAQAHPHAFPLVATRPSAAPWVNPPLRSLRWIESVITNLHAMGFSDEQILFTYRAFNSFLLGYLLLETSSMVLNDPAPGDGSFQRGEKGRRAEPVDGYPMIHRLRVGLTEDRFEEEFSTGLDLLLDRIAARLDEP